MSRWLAGAIGFCSLMPGVAVLSLGGVGLQPIIVFLLAYISLAPIVSPRLPLQPLLWIFLSLVGYAATTLFSISPGFSARFSAMQGIYAALGAIGFATLLSVTEHRRAFVRGYIFCAVLSSVIAFVQMTYSIAYGSAWSFANNTNFSIVPVYGRGAAFTPESSALAALLIPAILCCWFEKQAQGTSLLAPWQRSWAVLLILVIGLISTKSSSAFYFPLVLVFAAAFHSKSIKEFFSGGLKLVIITAVAALLFVPLYATRISNNDAPASTAWRLTKIETGFKIFLAHPIIGAGTGLVSDADFFGPQMSIPPDLSWDTDTQKGVDSTSVRILAETGLVGFCIAYYPLVLFFRRMRILAQSSAFRAIGTLSLGLLFSQIFITGYRDLIILLFPSIAFAVAGSVTALLTRRRRGPGNTPPRLALPLYPNIRQRSF